jgi:hypothetical protein
LFYKRVQNAASTGTSRQIIEFWLLKRVSIENNRFERMDALNEKNEPGILSEASYSESGDNLVLC